MVHQGEIVLKRYQYDFLYHGVPWWSRGKIKKNAAGLFPARTKALARRSCSDLLLLLAEAMGKKDPLLSNAEMIQSA